jgi:hypothetical protein
LALSALPLIQLLLLVLMHGDSLLLTVDYVCTKLRKLLTMIV